MGNVNEQSGVGGIAGFQVPIGIRKRKKKVDEMLDLNPDLRISEAIAYFSGLDVDGTRAVEEMLDHGQYVRLSESIRDGFAENALRQIVRRRIREVVRKNDSGGFSLYVPNPGKKKGSRKVGDFTTKIAARRAELSRFPPKDPKKLSRLKKDVEKLKKDPTLAAKKRPDTAASKAKHRRKHKKNDSVERLALSIVESLFREEKVGSQWDEYVSGLSKQAVLADKTFQDLQKNIAKRSEKALSSSVSSLKSALSSKGFNVEGGDVKKDPERGAVFVEVSVGDEEGTARVGPLYIAVENGYPKIQVSPEAKNGLTRLDPERGKVLRAELMTFQEDVLDSDETVAEAVAKRDEYLNRIEKKIDGFVADLNSLEITMLKNVLVSKYRKIS